MIEPQQYGLRRWRTAAAITATGALMASSLAMLAPVAADDAIDGSQTAGDTVYPNIGNGDYDAQHYDVAIKYDPATNNMIKSTTTMTAKTDKTLRTFSLDFKDLTVDSVKVNGEVADFTRINDPAELKYKLVIEPAEPVTGTFEAEIEYSGIPNHFVDPDGSWEGWVKTPDGASAVNEPVGTMTWYPNNNTPSDKATHKFTIDIPRNGTDGRSLAAASNGILKSKSTYSEGGQDRTIWTWDQPKPQATYLSLVSIGAYRVYENDIELLNGRTIKEWSFIDSGISGNNLTTTLNNRLRIQEIMQWMESKFGPYPGVSAGIVVDVTSLGYALETQDRSFFERSVSLGTLIHEIGHQWFGNAVSPKNWTDIWMNEGPATYLPQAFDYDKGNNQNSPVTRLRSSWNGRAANHSSWTIPPKIVTGSQLFNNWSVYQRPGQMLGAMEDIMGNEGFVSFMREWVTRYMYESAGQEEFFALATEMTGLDFTPFGQDWINAPTKPAWPGDPDKFDIQPVSIPNLGISGSGRVGKTLSVKTGDWPELMSLSYQWMIDGEDVDGATDSTFEITADMLDSIVGVTLVAEGDRIAPITQLYQRPAPIVKGSVGSLDKPTVTGKALAGKTLKAKVAKPAGTTLSYQWLRNGDVINGATSKNYKVKKKDVKKRLSVRVTASKDGSISVRKTSDRTNKVQLQTLTKTPKPVIKGKAVHKNVLSVKTGKWNKDVKLKFQWLKDGKVISKKSTYKVKKADEGKKIRVSVTGSKKNFESVTKKSASVKVKK